MGFDLTASGWVGGATAYLGCATAYLAGVLDGIKVISAQLGLGFGMSLAISPKYHSGGEREWSTHFLIPFLHLHLPYFSQKIVVKILRRISSPNQSYFCGLI